MFLDKSCLIKVFVIFTTTSSLLLQKARMLSNILGSWRIAMKIIALKLVLFLQWKFYTLSRGKEKTGENQFIGESARDCRVR
jgi:hypothetical protein